MAKKLTKKQQRKLVKAIRTAEQGSKAAAAKPILQKAGISTPKIRETLQAIRAAAPGSKAEAAQAIFAVGKNKGTGKSTGNGKGKGKSEITTLPSEEDYEARKNILDLEIEEQELGPEYDELSRRINEEYRYDKENEATNKERSLQDYARAYATLERQEPEDTKSATYGFHSRGALYSGIKNAGVQNVQDEFGRKRTDTGQIRDRSLADVARTFGRATDTYNTNKTNTEAARVRDIGRIKRRKLLVY